MSERCENLMGMTGGSFSVGPRERIVCVRERGHDGLCQPPERFRVRSVEVAYKPDWRVHFPISGNTR